MKRALILFFILLSGYVYSCSVAFRSFCETVTSGNVVVRCVMIDSVQHGRRFKVLDVIKGTENRDTITVWNGTDFDCNGPWSLSAEYMGNIGDTLLAALTVVDTVREAWQVLGNYVRTYNFGYTPELHYSNDTLTGIVAGSYFAPPQYALLQIAYSDFLQFWNSHAQSCYQLLDINETPSNALHFYPNPAEDNIYLNQSLQNIQYALHSLTGAVVKTGCVYGSAINVANVASGVYFLQLQTLPHIAYFNLVKR